MTIPVPQLDDRRFQDIVDEAKRAIPRHFKEWTNHNVSDPGVALIELFAWMTEMTLYRMNQVPDKLYSEFLNLVGVGPFPAQPAAADLTFWLSSPDVTDVLVPANTQVATTTGVDGSVIFATDADLLMRQPDLTALLTKTALGQYVDKLGDMEHPRTNVPCFDETDPAPGDEMIIGFSESMGAAALQLTIDCTSEGLGIDPGHPPLAWETWTGKAWARTTVYEDETGGLNKPGRIVLLLDPEHDELRRGPTSAYWLRLRLRKPQPGERFYEASPRIRAMDIATIGGTASAHHGEPHESVVLGASDGEPGQAFLVPNRPNLAPNENEHVTVSGHPWHRVDNFAAATPTSRVYVWDLNAGEISFGPVVTLPDGSQTQMGAIPPKGTEIVLTGHRVGGGNRGNVAAGTLRSMRTTIPHIASVENLRRARGGVDAELVENAKVRGPLALRSGDRAVTIADYERIASDSAPEIARVWCRPPADIGAPVRLMLVPHVDADPAFQELDDFALRRELYEKVRDGIEARRVVGSACRVTTPFYQGVSVVAKLLAEPFAEKEDLVSRVRARLYEFINPVVGGHEGDGLPFDEPITDGMIEDVIEGIAGVAEIEDVALYTADVRPPMRLGMPRSVVHPEVDTLFLSVRHKVVVV